MNTTEWFEGVAAFFAGLDFDANPYDIADESNDKWDEWFDGWEAAEEGRAR